MKLLRPILDMLASFRQDAVEILSTNLRRLLVRRSSKNARAHNTRHRSVNALRRWRAHSDLAKAKVHWLGVGRRRAIQALAQVVTQGRAHRVAVQHFDSFAVEHKFRRWSHERGRRQTQLDHFRRADSLHRRVWESRAFRLLTNRAETQRRLRYAQTQFDVIFITRIWHTWVRGVADQKLDLRAHRWYQERLRLRTFNIWLAFVDNRAEQGERKRVAEVHWDHFSKQRALHAFHVHSKLEVCATNLRFQIETGLLTRTFEKWDLLYRGASFKSGVFAF